MRDLVFTVDKKDYAACRNYLDSHRTNHSQEPFGSGTQFTIHEDMTEKQIFTLGFELGIVITLYRNKGVLRGQ